LLRPADYARLVTLAALWGASYLFMRVAEPHVGSVAMVEGRTLVAGAMLVAFAAATRQSIAFRRFWKHYLFIGAVAVAIPITLIGFALRDIDASTAAILNATSPLFSAVIASLWIHERLTVPKVTGIALCIAGIAVLVGWTPRPMSSAELLACGMSICASVCYGYSSVYTKVYLQEAPPMGVPAGASIFAALLAAPFAPWTILATPVPAIAWACVAALGVLSTGVAFILYYRLIADVGPVRAMTVTLLVPVFGVFWGVVLLGEHLTPGRILGGAIILVGCGLILGLIRLPSKATAG
jgi:drug/metabolite transporter (DMT)-like permease